MNNSFILVWSRIVFLLAIAVGLSLSAEDCPDFDLGFVSLFEPGQNGSSLKKCAYNGEQCCTESTIELFEAGVEFAFSDYAPNFLNGFDTAQDVIDELKIINKDIIPHIAEDILRPSLLSAVSSPSSYFTVAVNNTLTDIVSVLNGSSVNLTVTYAQYATAVAFHYFNVTPTQSSRISNGSSNCIHQAILNHVYKTDYAVELVELFGNISAAIKILKQLPQLYDQLYRSSQSITLTDTCLDVFSTNFLCPLCHNQPPMCPGRCAEVITGCVSPFNQAIVQLDASFRLILSITKGLTGSSSSVTNSVNVSRIPALHSNLIATVMEFILDSDFLQTINSCGIKSFSTPSKRSLNEYLIVKHKRSSSVLNVGINASFFREFERKLNLSDGNVVKTVKEKFCSPTFSIEYFTLEIKITANNGMCSYGVGNTGTYISTFTQEDIGVQTLNNPAGQFNYTQLLNQARNQTYVITELFSNSDISPTLFNVFLPNEEIPNTDFLSVTVPIDLSTVTTTTTTATTTTATISVMKTSPVITPTAVMKPTDSSGMVISYSLIIMLGCSMLAKLL